MSLSIRIYAIKSMSVEVTGKDSPFVAEFGNIERGLDELRVERNLVIHGEWIFWAEKPYVIEHKARSGIVSSPKLPDPENMEKLRQAIETAANKIRDFSWKIRPSISDFYREV
jgi:hypothetical protein